MSNLKTFSLKNKSQQRGKTSLLTPSRLVASIVLGAFFFNTGVFPVRLIIVTTADELPADYEFKAPQTVNIQSAETKDFDGYDNLIKVEIPEDRQVKTTGDNAEIISNLNKLQNEVPVIDTTLPVTISNLMKSYQQRILLALNSPDSETALRTILANAYPTIQETIQNAYASQPFTTNSVMALFNNTNYLGLRRDAEDKKAKDKESAKNKLIDQNNKLRTILANVLKTIKEKFRKQKLATLNRLTNLKNSQEQNINSLTNQIKDIPQKLKNLKQQIQDKLNQVNYFQDKENQHLADYRRYDEEYNHDKKKYKKYKKKYKKKHKSKYKKRYKKYKKRYKTAKRRRDTHRDRFNNYRNQKNQAHQDYLNLQKQLQAYKDNQTVLMEQLSLARKENEKTKAELNEKTESALGGPASWEASINNDQNYQAETSQALANFNASRRRLEDDYNNTLNQTEKTYQSNLEKAETYKEIVNENKEDFFGKKEDNKITLTKAETEEKKQAEKEFIDNYIKENKSGNNDVSYLKYKEYLSRAEEKDIEKKENNNQEQGDPIYKTVPIMGQVAYKAYKTVTEWVIQKKTVYENIKKTIKERAYKKVKYYVEKISYQAKKKTYYVKEWVKKAYYKTVTETKYVWKKVTSWVKKGWSWFKKKVKKLVRKTYRYTKKFYKWTSKKVKKVKTYYQKVVKKVKRYRKEIYYKTKTVYEKVKRIIKERILKPITRAITKFKEGIIGFKKVIIGYAIKAKEFVKSLPGEIASGAKSLYNKAKKAFEDYLKSLKENEARKKWEKETGVTDRRKRVDAEKKFDDFVEIPADAKLGALLSRRVYKKNGAFIELPAGVRNASAEELAMLGINQSDLDIDESGFRMRVYYNENTGKYTFSFAGTNPDDENDVKTDIEQAEGLETDQYKKARELGLIIKAKIENGELNSDMIKVTGQSLGGGLAALFGAITNCETKTFNAAGVHDETLKRAGVNPDNIKTRNFSNITNHVAQGDMLTYLQEDSTVQDMKLLMKNKNKIEERLKEIRSLKGSEYTASTITANIALSKIQKAEKYIHKNISEELLDEVLRDNSPRSLRELLPDALGQKVRYGSEEFNTEFQDEIKEKIVNPNLYVSTKGLVDRIVRGVEQHGQYSNY
jgi:hypothetical protein